MKRGLLLIALTAFLTGAGPAKEDAVKEEIRKLEGTWRCTSVEVGGKRLPEEKVKEAGIKLEIKGDKWSLKSKTFNTEMTCRIDPTQKPKAVDTKHEKGKTNLAIYELDGDKLKFCDAGQADRPRPKDFSTEAGTPQTLWVFEREKP